MKALIEGALFPPVERKGSPPSRTRWPREEAVPRSRRGGGGGGQTWIHEQKLFCHSMLASFTAPLAGRATPLGEHRERPGRAAPVGVSRGSGRTVVLGVFSGNDHTSAYSRRGGEGGAPDPSQLHRPPLARRCRWCREDFLPFAKKKKKKKAPIGRRAPERRLCRLLAFVALLSSAPERTSALPSPPRDRGRPRRRGHAGTFGGRRSWHCWNSARRWRSLVIGESRSSLQSKECVLYLSPRATLLLPSPLLPIAHGSAARPLRGAAAVGSGSERRGNLSGCVDNQNDFGSRLEVSRRCGGSWSFGRRSSRSRARSSRTGRPCRRRLRSSHLAPRTPPGQDAQVLSRGRALPEGVSGCEP